MIREETMYTFLPLGNGKCDEEKWRLKMSCITPLFYQKGYFQSDRSNI